MGAHRLPTSDLCDWGNSDTMRGSTGCNAGGTARFHGILLVDPGSCLDPGAQTITLQEWRAQQVPTSHGVAKHSVDVGKIGEAQGRWGGPGRTVPHVQGTDPEPIYTTTQPEGKYISRVVGEKFKGTVYHLFMDCGLLERRVNYADQPETVQPDWIVKEIDDDTIELLGLKMCAPCDRRTKIVDPMEVFDKALMRATQGLNEKRAKWVRRQILHDLLEQGYALRKVTAIKDEDRANAAMGSLEGAPRMIQHEGEPKY